MAIRLKKRAMRYGVHLPGFKPTALSRIEPVPLPERVVIPLSQNAGEPAKPLVRRGEKVLAGQKIGDSENPAVLPVHATLSGEVSASIKLVEPASGCLGEALVITSDGEDKWVETIAGQAPEKLSREEILGRIREAGIVDLSHLKPPEGKKINTVILNSGEYEPYMTADYRVMLEYGEEVATGLGIIKRALMPQDVYIAIEDNQSDVIEHLGRLIQARDFKDVKIVPVKPKYPAGAEKTLISTLLGREVPLGRLPEDIGVMVVGVTTTRAISDAVVRGRPFVEQVVTVTGAVRHPKNLLVRLGTPLGHLIDYCGGMTEDASEVILGGPMTGVCHYDLDFPVTKGTNCVLVHEAIPAEEQDCIRCGRCLEVCPLRLAPALLARYAKAGRYDECQKAYIDSCNECGACAYVCPANIPLVQYIKVAKKELAKGASTK